MNIPATSKEAFPEQLGRTRQFTLGVPQNFTLGDQRRAVYYLRTKTGRDAVKALWRFDCGTGESEVIADPDSLLTGSGVRYCQYELDLREHRRELAGGLDTYSVAIDLPRAAFAMSGRLWHLDVPLKLMSEIPADGHAHDAQISPSGEWIAYLLDGSVHAVDVATGTSRSVVEPDGDAVRWGIAEFVAAGDMGRNRGLWWSPDSDAMLVARVDEAMVDTFYLSDPTDPTQQPRSVRYPRVGHDNADVSLWIIQLDGRRTEVDLDWDHYEYFVWTSWSRAGLFVLIQDRSQRAFRLLEIDPSTGESRVVHAEDSEHWLLKMEGAPTFTSSRQLVWITDIDGSKRLLVGGEPVTPIGLEVRSVAGVDDVGGVVFEASREPTEQDVWHWSQEHGLTQLSSGPGVSRAFQDGDLCVIVQRRLTDWEVRTTVTLKNVPVGEIPSVAEQPVVSPTPVISALGERQLRSVLLLPETFSQAGGEKLPVLLDPYGGPAKQRVLAAADEYWVSQWFANQGYAVLITDGRGTQARGTEWERSVKGDTLSAPLEDQIDALHAAAAIHPVMDLNRVAMRGWSYGGFMSTAAVLRRPEVVHAAVAGASDADARLYSTYFKERYLGRPDDCPSAYDATSLIEEAPNLTRPLMILHGMADDNVYFGHALRLSDALFRAGIFHTVMPMVGASHMLSEPIMIKNRLLMELTFLDQALKHRDAG